MQKLPLPQDPLGDVTVNGVAVRSVAQSLLDRVPYLNQQLTGARKRLAEITMQEDELKAEKAQVLDAIARLSGEGELINALIQTAEKEVSEQKAREQIVRQPSRPGRAMPVVDIEQE